MKLLASVACLLGLSQAGGVFRDSSNAAFGNHFTDANSVNGANYADHSSCGYGQKHDAGHHGYPDAVHYRSGGNSSKTLVKGSLVLVTAADDTERISGGHAASGKGGKFSSQSTGYFDSGRGNTQTYVVEDVKEGTLHHETSKSPAGVRPSSGEWPASNLYSNGGSSSQNGDPQKNHETIWNQRKNYNAGSDWNQQHSKPSFHGWAQGSASVQSYGSTTQPPVTVQERVFNVHAVRHGIIEHEVAPTSGASQNYGSSWRSSSASLAETNGNRWPTSGATSGPRSGATSDATSGPRSGHASIAGSSAFRKPAISTQAKVLVVESVKHATIQISQVPSSGESNRWRQQSESYGGSQHGPRRSPPAVSQNHRGPRGPSYEKTPMAKVLVVQDIKEGTIQHVPGGVPSSDISDSQHNYGLTGSGHQKAKVLVVEDIKHATVEFKTQHSFSPSRPQVDGRQTFSVGKSHQGRALGATNGNLAKVYVVQAVNEGTLHHRGANYDSQRGEKSTHHKKTLPSAFGPNFSW